MANEVEHVEPVAEGADISLSPGIGMKRTPKTESLKEEEGDGTLEVNKNVGYYLSAPPVASAARLRRAFPPPFPQAVPRCGL